MSAALARWSPTAARSSTAARSRSGSPARTGARRAALLKDALAAGRAEIARRLARTPYAGTETAAAYAFLTDQILRLVYDYVTERLHPLANPTTSERLLLMAVGGYGRGEMALHSDVDIAFVTPWKPTGWTETVIEAILYLLWDLGLKVGHSTAQRRRDGPRRRRAIIPSAPRSSKSRYVWGDEALYDEVQARFWKEVVAGNVARLRQGEARRARRAPQADGRQPLRRRAQRQGGQGRPARPPYPVLDRQICLSAA